MEGNGDDTRFDLDVVVQKTPERCVIHLGIAVAPVCRPSLQEPPPEAQLWESPEPWDANTMNVRAEITWLCLSA